MKTYKQVREARAAKYGAEAEADRNAAAKAAAEAAAWSPVDATIGVLCRKGKPVYYTFVRGVYLESKDLAGLAVLTAKLA